MLVLLRSRVFEVSIIRNSSRDARKAKIPVMMSRLLPQKG
jgi:hypothetical protein